LQIIKIDKGRELRQELDANLSELRIIAAVLFKRISKKDARRFALQENFFI
jgi:hypothetical protein